MNVRPFGLHTAVAVLVLIFGALMAAGIVPFSALMVGVLIVGLAIAIFF